MDNLNEEQKLAVTTTEGYVRVIAGAGSGKTKALTNRYVYLVNELGVSTSNILCVTFTNKAANEMKRRIRSMIGDQDTGLICTFHGFCVQLLREDIHTMNYPSNFVVMDSEDTDAILKNVYQQANISSKNYTFTQAKNMISDRKFLSDYIEHWILEMDSTQLKQKYLYAEKIEERVFCGYLYEQKKCFGLDYDDLLIFALYILNEFKEKREKWQNKLEYIMVDEFQDSNDIQNDLVSLISRGNNVFRVGDIKQSIYGFRHAKPQLMRGLIDHADPQKDEIIYLSHNYRSKKEIVSFNNKLFRELMNLDGFSCRYAKEDDVNIGIDAQRQGGQPIIFHALDQEALKTESDEIKTANEWKAEYIAAKIVEIKQESNRSWKDFAVLVRANERKKDLKRVFDEWHIP